MNAYHRIIGVFAFLFLMILGEAPPTIAAPQVTLSGDTQQGPVTADPNGRYTFVNTPLRKNSINKFTVTAQDGDQVQKKEVVITQVSLDSVVVSRIKSEPLSVQEIEQLVNDGIIDIDDPANFNVSKFQIVLTIGKQEVFVDVPMVRKITEEMGEGDVAPKSDPGNGKSDPKPIEVVVFEAFPPPLPGGEPAPSIPGVLIIEGRIKTLKEFYSVRLLLMNTSGIFTLHDVNAELEFPDGGLSHTLPLDGIVQFGDILPGDFETPGQKEREFIIRGDEIGIRKVRVHFGGTLIGGGIPEEELVPFSGSAETTVEVKGPPEFRVSVIHPPAVVADIPYEFIVDIQNIGQTPALYTSFELDVGADGYLVDCAINESTGEPVCTPIEGSAIRNIGHLLPGDSTRQSFMINPLVSGDITSCISQADQNIDLQVFVGAMGCLVGKRPQVKSPDGIPTVTVLPTANMFGVSMESPVVAFFNELMNTSTVTTGTGGSFNVLDEAGAVVPGQLRFITLNDATVAIWQVNDGITNRLHGNETYEVQILNSITDNQGFTIEHSWISTFTTTDPKNDTTPPTMTLAVEPPVNPNNVLSGQIIRLNAYAADQGSGLSRIEMRVQDTSVPDSDFELIDQKTIFPESEVPYIFAVDSANLIPGHIYQFKATGFDKANNAQDVTLAVIMAQSTAPPTIVLPADPATPVLHGISVTVTPETLTGGVTQVDYFLDSAAVPFKTVTLAPFSATLNTLGLSLGNHTIKAVVTDGLGQTGEDIFAFVLAENLNEPSVNFGSSVDGAQYVTGSLIAVNGNAQDPLGITGVKFFLDNPAGAPIATTTEPFNLDTEGLSLGIHKLYFEATNALGIKNDLNSPASYLEFEVLAVPPPGPPPAAPVITEISFPVNGKVTIKGTSVAGAKIDITNITQGLLVTVFAAADGKFEATLDAEAADEIKAVAFKLNQSPNPSAPAEGVVPNPPLLNSITVNPTSRTFTAVNQLQDITVTGIFNSGPNQNVTSQALFFSSNSSIASVNASGRVVPIANGDAIITIDVDGLQAQVTITVNIVTLTSISIDPGTFEIVGTAKTRQLTMVGHYSNSTTANIPANQVAFSTTNSSVAIVNPSGLVTSTGFGDATIIAAVSGLLPAQSAVTVSQVVPTGILVAPNSILFTDAGETRQLEITVELSDGNTAGPQGMVEFESDDTAIASVNAGGVVTSIASGETILTVTHAGFTATVSVVVEISSVLPPPEILEIDRPKAAEGDIFVIRGLNFAAIPNDNDVRINSLQAQVQSARQDELTVIVPEGATSGPVTVKVANQVSNDKTLLIYARTAKSFEITLPVDIPATAGQKLNLPGPVIDFRAGDKVYLSSAPDILAPLNFNGILRASIDGGAFFTVNLSANAIDLTGSLTPGDHTITLELSESGGKFKTAGIYLVSGPDATGPIAGIRSILALQQSRPTPVTFINLKDTSGNPLPDGSKVAITIHQIGVNFPDGSCCVNSVGGTLVNGQGLSPNDARFQVFTVQGGRVDVIYDPLGAGGMSTAVNAVARLQVIPADASGSRIGFKATAVGEVNLVSVDTAASPRSQSSAIADGVSKTVIVKLESIRDSFGNIVPDGSRIAVTTHQIGVNFPDGTCCVNSVGGTIVNSEGTSPNDSRFFVFTVTNGEIEVHYDTGAVLLGTSEVRIANLQYLPAEANGSRIGFRAFTIVPITLSSPNAPASVTAVPASLLADVGDNRTLITLSKIVDAIGNPVPDGTKIAVTTQQIGVNPPEGGCCVNSAGGTIINGQGTSPNDSRFSFFTVQNNQVEIVYSSMPVALPSRASAISRVQILPADVNGSRIGFKAFSVVDINLVGYETAEALAQPPGVIADGQDLVTVTLTGIRDTQGNLVPDGAKIAITTLQIGVNFPDGSCCVNSAGGSITNSEGLSANDTRFVYFTVNSGQVTITYDPAGVLVPAGEVATANLQIVPATPTGNTIGFRAFRVVPITLSSPSADVANITVIPASVLADGANNQSQVTVSQIKDAVGNTAPNGNKVSVTTQQIGVNYTDGACCVNSAGGTITNSAVTSPNDSRFKVITIQSGKAIVDYSSTPVTLESRTSATGRVQILPADINGNRIGFRTFALAEVALAGYFSADIAGPGTLAPNTQVNYTVTNIRDTSGNLVPNGSKIAVTTQQIGVQNPDGSCCVNSIGGTLTGEGIAANDGRFQTYTIVDGAITISYQAPATTGTAALQLIPADPNKNRIGFRTFAVKAVEVSS